nr:MULTISPECIES: ABC transporter permease subunit [unclassified Paenibacillus]
MLIAKKQRAPAGATHTRTAAGRNYKWLMVKRNKALYLFILPAFLYFFIFAYIPMYGVQIAFKDFIATKGFGGSPWADPLLKHFITFFSSVRFGEIFWNTIRISLYYLLISFPAPIILALMINEVRGTRFKKLVQNITYMPYFISTVVLVGMIDLFFSNSGLVNQLTGLFGLEPVLFLQKEALFDHMYVWSGVWQATGYGSVIYFAALAGVSPELHEAATIDGATRLQRVIHVNIPAIMPTIIIMLIISVGGIMNLSFEKVLLMQKDINIASSEVISTYVYKLGIQKAQYSLSSAVGLFNNLINLALLIMVNRIARKVGETSLW